MKIVLVRPDYDTPSVAPYLGIGYLSSSLKALGVEVVLIDNLLHKYPLDILVNKIRETNPDAVGICCLSAFYQEVKTLSLKLKENGLRVIIGGVHPTFLPYSTLNDTKCDFVICGEGEKAICDLVTNNFDNTNIKGVYKLGDITTDRGVEFAQPIENLDDIPFPDWMTCNQRNIQQCH